MGEYPLLRRNFPEGIPDLDIIKTLLSGAEVSLKLGDNVTFSMCARFLTPFTPLSNIDPGVAQLDIECMRDIDFVVLCRLPDHDSTLLPHNDYFRSDFRQAQWPI